MLVNHYLFNSPPPPPLIIKPVNNLMYKANTTNQAKHYAFCSHHHAKKCLAKNVSSWRNGGYIISVYVFIYLYEY